MPDKLMRAIVTIPRTTGNSEDAIVNTFHFDGDDNHADSEYHTAVMSGLTAFYQSIDHNLASILASPATVKIYDLRDPLPRVPEFTGTIALTIPAGTDLLPAEVALCLSFQAAAESGQSQKRRRGRIYFGPLGAGLTIEASGDVRPNSTLQGQLRDAGDVLVNGIPLPVTGSVKWAVFSPTTVASGGTLEEAFNDVTNGWVDDAFDTIRSRGAKPTGRLTFAA